MNILERLLEQKTFELYSSPTIEQYSKNEHSERAMCMKKLWTRMNNISTIIGINLPKNFHTVLSMMGRNDRFEFLYHLVCIFGIAGQSVFWIVVNRLLYYLKMFYCILMSLYKCMGTHVHLTQFLRNKGIFEIWRVSNFAFD